MTVLKHRADLVSVIETANAGPPLDEGTWLDEMRGACAALFANTKATGFHVLDMDPTLALRGERASISVETDPANDAAHAFATFSESDKRALYFPASPVLTLRTVMPGLGAAATSVARSWLEDLGAKDLLLVVMHPVPGRILVLWAAQDSVLVLDRRERTTLVQLALHIEAGYRARARPQSVRAELAEDGSVVWRTEDGPHDEARGAPAVSRNASIPRDGIDLWAALVAGKVSLVPRRVEGKRRYAVIENTPLSGSLRQLTDDERAVVGLAARGAATKHVAGSLGVSSSLVSLRLALAAGKLGVATRAELVRVAALLSRERGRGTPTARASLTDAERAVLALLQRGLTNRQIAKERGTSVRTVANQVASLLKKVDSHSRRALVVCDTGGYLPSSAAMILPPAESDPLGVAASSASSAAE